MSEKKKSAGSKRTTAKTSPARPGSGAKKGGPARPAAAAPARVKRGGAAASGGSGARASTAPASPKRRASSSSSRSRSPAESAAAAFAAAGGAAVAPAAPPPPPDANARRREASKKTALAIALAALDKKAERVEIIDIGEKVDYADYLVVMTGRSDRQVQAIARGIEDALRPDGQRAEGIEGMAQGQWVLLNYGDVIVHVFLDEARKYYDLEGLWMDAPRVPTPSFGPRAVSSIAPPGEG